MRHRPVPLRWREVLFLLGSIPILFSLGVPADAAYLTNDLYETTASAQVKSLGVVSGSTATSATDGSKEDQVKAVTSSPSAKLTLQKSADKGPSAPGNDATYTVNCLYGIDLIIENNVFVTDPIPANTGFTEGTMQGGFFHAIEMAGGTAG